MPALVPVIIAIPFVFAAWVIHRVLRHRCAVAQLRAGVEIPGDVTQAIQQRRANLEASVCTDERALPFAAWVIHRVLRHRYAVAQLRAGGEISAAQDIEQRLANLEAIACSDERSLPASPH